MSAARRKASPERRSRGRPRSQRVDKALFDAAVGEFVERGYRGMSMESVAARAGVSKVSLYRRWKSKADVVADVLGLMGEATPLADRGGLEADLRFLIDETVGSPHSRTTARTIMRTLGEISDDPELLVLYRERLLAPRLQQARALVERARMRDELREGLSIDIAASIIGGPLFLYYLAVLAEVEVDLPPDLVDSLLKTMLVGIAKEHPLPGRAPQKR
jgi:AcrR family transcriptional regulator